MTNIYSDPTATNIQINLTEYVHNNNKFVENLEMVMVPEFFENMNILPDLPGYTSQVTDDKWQTFMKTLGNMDTMNISK